MTILVVGANGATGQQLVEQLLIRGQSVRAMVRSPNTLSAALKKHDKLSIICASISELGVAEIAQHTNGCIAVASCLGHNLSFSGIYGQPRRLVAEATRRLCTAIKANKSDQPTKFVLMNTAGNRNQDLHEPVSLGQRCVVGLIRWLLPPHADNEAAADYLRTEIGQNDSAIEWAAVRPDELINAAQVSAYEVYPSPIRSAIFNAGKTSRINVGHFMAELVTDEDTWSRWQGKMPVIYNKDAVSDL